MTDTTVEIEDISADICALGDVFEVTFRHDTLLVTTTKRMRVRKNTSVNEIIGILLSFFGECDCLDGEWAMNEASPKTIVLCTRVAEHIRRSECV